MTTPLSLLVIYTEGKADMTGFHELASDTQDSDTQEGKQACVTFLSLQVTHSRESRHEQCL